MLKGLIAERRVLRLSGPEAVEFFQDLVTNDVMQAGEDRAVYAALLSPQGKYQSDFFVLREGADALLIDVAAAFARPLAQRLAMYRLRRQVDIADSGLLVGLVWGEAPQAAPEEARVVADPRDPALGWRVYARNPAEALTEMGAEPAPAEAYAALRVAAEAPESGVELTPDSFVLEAGFERLNGVDFRKGCFVGQEIVARMKHKAALRKGLVRVAVEGEAPPPGTPVTTAEGKPAGTLYTVAGGEGLAQVRFDRAEGEMLAGEARLRRV
jgi:folate-binding protein YgfZ